MKRLFVSWSTCAAVVAVLSWMSIPAAAQRGGPERAARVREAAAKPTPRTADGRPDLTGNWSEPPFQGIGIAISPDGRTLTVREPDAPDLDANQARLQERTADRSVRPPYKREFVPRQRELMYTASLVDPGLHCYPYGVPRIGPPTEIVLTAEAVYLLYDLIDTRRSNSTHRIVPIGGQHDPERDPLPNGDSIAWWEQDTLVVDVVNLDPETWMSSDGDFHSDALHVVERFTRKGNTLEYQVTIEDPKVLTEPWRPVGGTIANDRIGSRIGDNALLLREGAHGIGDYPCVERDRDNKVNYDRPF